MTILTHAASPDTADQRKTGSSDRFYFSLFFMVATGIGIAFVLALSGFLGEWPLYSLKSVADALNFFGEEVALNNGADQNQSDIALSEAQNTAMLGLIFYILLSLIYFVSTWSITQRRVLENTDFHDSFYYMGFVLTLTALASSVVQLASLEEPQREQQLGAVIAGNAIAVSSTIVGLIIRNILAFRMTETLSHQEQLSAETAMVSLSTIGENLPAASSGLEDLEKRIRSLPDICRELTASIEDLNGKVSNSSNALKHSEIVDDQFWEKLDDQFQKTNESIFKISRGLERLTNEIDRAGDEAKRAGDEFSTAFKKMTDRVEEIFAVLGRGRT